MTNQPKTEWIDFGFETVPVNEKQSRVADVFSSVASSYDIMNDLMSGGVHRLWKDALMDWLAPRKGQVLIDLAGGTGDIALRFLKRGGSYVHVVDINPDMISAGKKRSDIKAYSNQLDWTVASAEDIPLQTGTAERVTISFGLRNVTNRDKALREAFRVLKPGGRSAASNFQLFRMLHFLNYMISGHLTPCHSWAGWLRVTKPPIVILLSQSGHFPHSMALPE